MIILLFSIKNIIFKIPNNFKTGENWEFWSVGGDNHISFTTSLYEHVKPVKYFQHHIFNLIINGRCILTHLSVSFDTYTRACSAISFDLHFTIWSIVGKEETKAVACLVERTYHWAFRPNGLVLILPTVIASILRWNNQSLHSFITSKLGHWCKTTYNRNINPFKL